MLVRKKYSLELSIIYINHIFCNPCGDLLKLDTLMLELIRGITSNYNSYEENH